VNVIVTSATPPTVAAKQATSAIPIVFASVGDPVGAGVVESLARPGGNATGLSLQTTDAAGKRLELLRDVVPGLRRVVGYLVSAYLADRIGRRANFILFAVCSVVTVLVYTQLPITDTMMLFLGLPLGFFASGIFSGMGAFLTENFPTRIRGSGQGFAYNFGRGVAALNPTFVRLLSSTLTLGQSIGVCSCRP
jgi:ABC transporter substrate binding protein/Major Facilitator Superfamily